MAENKVTFGLKNCYYAPYSFDELGNIVYETPKHIPGAVELSNEPRGDLIEFYADNQVYYSAPNNQGYESTLTIAKIPDHFMINVLGEEKDESDGTITEVANAKTKPFALMFEFDGDIRATRHVMFNCTANRPNVSSSTKTDSVEPNTNELSLVASPIEMNDKLVVKTKTTETTPQSVYNMWFDSVYNTTPVAVTGVTLEPASISLAVGEYQQMAVTLEPINASNKDVTYTTSDDTVATVTSGGLVEAIAVGTATITVTTADGGFTDTATVTVA
ncbi:hypothetical protein HMI01_10830 [Halolactibacillus miurensis]|uniref:Phage major tail protein, phi13 family n=1 Tax=Halolactibacillus miurensis TaxID=306541 RepID=A0A1I6SHR2_9BACI|nr:major tail protein [Halolactibacillus miurensis]GEM04095.1 hypothetical protein HMI01_10830 [Halolactibacillus miurensis]SFS76463.1 phage major tail protein, phi13 family [Halolactibacillus miurensis]